jgi:hypothetical protein
MALKAMGVFFIFFTPGLGRIGLHFLWARNSRLGTFHFGPQKTISEEDARKAITALDGMVFLERNQSVDEAKLPRRESRGFGSRQGRG